MCLAVPGLLLKRSGNQGEADFGGVTRVVALDLLPEASEGDYILIHAGFAVKLVDQDEALITLELFKEIELLGEADPEEGIQ